MPRSREIRLGVVLYGGVSLAVYENGMAQEMYRAVRGEGVWALLKDLIDSDVLVDIVSGTSAGGVNGLMLGYALANGKDFRSVAKLWRDDGDIERLLRSNSDPDAASLLDSRYYQERLEAAFADMGDAGKTSAATETGELDVFITGTNVAGEVETVYDDQGHAVDVKSHRAVFKLSFRRGRTPPKNDFDADGIVDLATLARITSCFPAAFAPVTVEAGQTRLYRWGKLKGPAVFLDGGILDNKPFSTTIDAIAGRTADREVERFLAYVEPDPEMFGGGAAAPPVAPTAAAAALDAISGIPRYQSIGADLSAIAAHNDQVQRIEELLRRLPPARPPGPDCPKRLSGNDAQAPEWLPYATARLMQLWERAAQGILNDAGGRGFFSQPSERRAASLLVKSFNHWKGDAAGTLANFDVYYRRRLLAYLRQTMRSHPDRRHPASAVRERLQRLWNGINHYYQIAEILLWAMETWVGRAAIEWRSLAQYPDEPGDEQLAAIAGDKWGEAARGFERLLSTAQLAIPAEDSDAARARFYGAMAERVEAPLKGDGPDGGKAEQETAPAGNLLLELDAAIRAMLIERNKELPHDIALREYCRFLEVDRIVFPLQFAAGSQSRDQIRVVRLSPVDAQRGLSARRIDGKLCGRTLGDFGGFFKKPWRANDILWGRLDGVCQLIECALTRERASQVWGGGGPVVKPADMLALFPKSPQLHARLAAELARIGALTEEEFQTLLNGLVEAAQNEILAEEWPRVIECALDQERTWAQRRRLPPDPAPGTAYKALNLSWEAAKSDPDRVLAALAAQAIAGGNLPDFQQFDIAGRPFLEEIPRPILFELAARVLARAGRSLTASIPNGDIRKRVEDSRLYGLIFRRIAPIAYGWARMMRTAPAWRVTMSVFLISACAAALAGGLVLGGLALFHVSLPWTAYALMVLIPLAALAIWGWIFRR